MFVWTFPSAGGTFNSPHFIVFEKLLFSDFSPSFPSPSTRSCSHLACCKSCNHNILLLFLTTVTSIRLVSQVFLPLYCILFYFFTFFFFFFQAGWHLVAAPSRKPTFLFLSFFHTHGPSSFLLPPSPYSCAIFVFFFFFFSLLCIPSPAPTESTTTSDCLRQVTPLDFVGATAKCSFRSLLFPSGPFYLHWSCDRLKVD